MQITYASAYSLELSTLNSLKDYLSNHQLKTKVDSKFSLKKKLYMGYYRILFSVQFCSTSCVTCSWFFMQPIILGVQMHELAKIFLCFSADQMKLKADKGLLLLNIIGKDRIH